MYPLTSQNRCRCCNVSNTCQRARAADQERTAHKRAQGYVFHDSVLHFGPRKIWNLAAVEQRHCCTCSLGRNEAQRNLCAASLYALYRGQMQCSALYDAFKFARRRSGPLCPLLLPILPARNLRRGWKRHAGARHMLHCCTVAGLASAVVGCGDRRTSYVPFGSQMN